MARTSFLNSGLLRVAQYWREFLLILVSLLIGYFMLEIAYRIYQHHFLPQKLYALVIASSATSADGKGVANTYVFDQYTGYRYVANKEGQRGPPWNSRWRTNSYGHVSSVEYPQKKPAGEYRIAVVGDSFTANINNNVRWTEALEKNLNSSQEWRARVGSKFTRVINFGVDGMGMVQFAAMVQHYAVGFEPDLIVVNFISDDILRRVRYTNLPTSENVIEGNREQVIRDFIQKNYLDKIDWLRIYPELLAAVAGRYLGMTAKMPLDARLLLAEESVSHYSDRREALNASVKAIDEIRSVRKEVLFLNVPFYHELVNEYQSMPWLKGVVDDLRKVAPQANIVSMAPYLDRHLEGKRYQDRPDLVGLTLHQIAALPDDRKLEIYRWFFLPDDVHYTDYGTSIYAREVANYMITHSNVGKPRSQ